MPNQHLKEQRRRKMKRLGGSNYKEASNDNWHSVLYALMQSMLPLGGLRACPPHPGKISKISTLRLNLVTIFFAKINVYSCLSS